MRLWLTRLVLAGALAGLGLWCWKTFYPTPEHAIKKRLVELARSANITPNESSLLKLAKSQKLASFFTVDAEIRVDMPGRFPQTLNGRDEVMQAAVSARAALKTLNVEFLDVNVQVGSDAQTGVAHFTVKAELPGESTPQVEELQAQFKKVEGDWLIQHIENVRTLR